MSVRIIGIGTAVPDDVITNDDLDRTRDTSDAGIRARTGIAERRVGGHRAGEPLREVFPHHAPDVVLSEDAPWDLHAHLFRTGDVGAGVVAQPAVADPAPVHEVLEGGDQLVFVGSIGSVVELQRLPGLEPATKQVFRLSAATADRRFVEADLKIATGLVEPHFMAGYSGGRKVIAPGIAHKDTITTFHSARFMEHPRAANCVLDGNPLHEAQLEIVAMLGGAFALNTVIDDERRLSFVNFGEIKASHLEAVEHIRAFATVPIEEKFQTIVTTAAGHPLDKTYYQTVKGMVGPLEIMADGADLIIASACSEGMGSNEFVEAQRRLVEHGPERFLESLLEKRFADIDEWQTEMQLKPMRIGKIKLFTEGLDEASRALTGIEVIDSVEQAVRASVARTGDPRVAVIPEGPYVVPVHRPRARAA